MANVSTIQINGGNSTIQINRGNLDTNHLLDVDGSHQLNAQRPAAPPKGPAPTFFTGPEVNLNYYRPLHPAAKEGDWVTAKSFIDNDIAALTEVIPLQGMMALHVAASNSQSEFVEKMADLMPAAALNAQDKKGCTALHYASVGGGNCRCCHNNAFVEKNRALPLTTDIDGKTPLFFAANWGARKEMLWYLSTVTTDEHPSYAFTGPCSSSLILGIAVAGFYG
ncbi:Hypothetical predicted protein [Olea europaea subsp. europaea]|uniref:Uncharacterized protein n=1 Tax=Olea europaea subsp. europaea TaxID=158383 RepID=A0A8S0UB97_OLEEU|nr:Hypothetical predicted protein [Olea europaea subsp. europaea]